MGSPLSCRAAPDAELGGDHELVAADGVVEIEESDGAGVPAARGLNGQRHAVGEVLVDQLVARHADAAGAFEIADHLVGLRTGEAIVEAQQRGPQPALEQNVALVGAFVRQLLRRHVGPAQPLQQPAGRVLGVVELVELVGRGHVDLMTSSPGMPSKSLSWVASGQPSAKAVAAIQASAACNSRPADRRSARKRAQTVAIPASGHIV